MLYFPSTFCRLTAWNMTSMQQSGTQEVTASDSHHHEPEWVLWSNEKLLDLPMSQLGVTLDGAFLSDTDSATQRRTRGQTAHIPPPLLVVKRMVYAGWGAGDCRAVLSGPFTTREA